jgi:hypothetical protein
MKRLGKKWSAGFWNTSIWLFLVAVVASFFPPALIIERQRFFKILDAVICSTAFVLALSSTRSVWRTIRMPVRKVQIEQVYVIGLFLISLAIAVCFGGLWAWRSFRKPDYIADSLFIASTRWVFAVGLILALLINLGEDGRLTVNSYTRTMALVAAAIIVAAVLSWLSA